MLFVYLVKPRIDLFTTPCAADGLNLPQGTQKEKKISNLIDELATGFGIPAWFGKNQPFNLINYR